MTARTPSTSAAAPGIRLSPAERTEFKQALRPVLALPPDRRDRPYRRFVEAANALRGWEL